MHTNTCNMYSVMMILYVSHFRVLVTMIVVPSPIAWYVPVITVIMITSSLSVSINISLVFL